MKYEILLINFIQYFSFISTTKFFIEKDFSTRIELIHLINDEILVGTTNFLHRLSSNTFDLIRSSSNLSSSTNEFHWKILLPIDNKSLLSCGTNSFGSCLLIDEQFHLIINSSKPVVANDPINSSLAMILPEENSLIYFAVTLNNNEKFRWQIPNLSVRSLNRSNWMKIISNENSDDQSKRFSSDEFSLKFLSRQQQNFIVQYIGTFSTEHFLYFVTKQPNDIDDQQITTKIIRFCRSTSSLSIIRSYSEMPLRCGNDQWIVKTIRTIVNSSNQTILLAHFHRRDRLKGTKFCFWNVEKDIDEHFLRNYHRCYSMGIGQRGLNFIKMNEPCRKDQIWINEMKMSSNLCQSLDNDRLISPLGVLTALDGHLFYENLFEDTTSLGLHSLQINRSILLFQSLSDGTFQLGEINQQWTRIHWFYSNILPNNRTINGEIHLHSSSLTYFFSSDRKIYRWSLVEHCASVVSKDQCLSSLNSSFCRWCLTVRNDGSTSILQFDFYPKNSSIDQREKIRIELKNVSNEENIQCEFFDEFQTIRSDVIRENSTHWFCLTPNKEIFRQKNFEYFRMNFTLIDVLTMKIRSKIVEFLFWNCSLSSSCQMCESETTSKRFHWCSNRCSSTCQFVRLSDPFHRYLPTTNRSMRIPLKFDQNYSSFQCRLNSSIIGSIDFDGFCHFDRISSNSIEKVFLEVFSSNYSSIPIGNSIEFVLLPVDSTENLRPTIKHFNSKRFFEFGGQILEIYGENLRFGFEQKLFIGFSQCSTILSMTNELFSCRLPSIRPGIYRITIQIDSQWNISSDDAIIISSNPIVFDVQPRRSFISGGQWINVQGENFDSAEEICVEFSTKKIRKKISIQRDEISQSNSFRFQSPSFSSENPTRVELSISFDRLIFFRNLVEFDYFADLSLNFSSSTSILSYQGEDLTIRIENLTDAAMIDDFQLFIGCLECRIKTFDSKGIRCQPPDENQIQSMKFCEDFNRTIVPIRFRLGFREFRLGFLRYSSIHRSIYLFIPIVFVSILFVFIFILFCFRRQSKKENESTEKSFWSTQTSATILSPPTTSYYQIYDEIPSFSFTFDRHKTKRLRTISVDSNRMKNLFFQQIDETNSFDSICSRSTLESFYDLLNLKIFRQSFVDHLIQHERFDLFDHFFYLFHWNSSIFDEFHRNSSIKFFEFLSTFSFYSENDLIECFRPFDDLLHSLIDFLHQSPIDEILQRSSKSLTSTNLFESQTKFHYEQIRIRTNFENRFQIDLNLFDCDSIEQIKEKFLHQFYSSNHSTNFFIDENQLEIFPLRPTNSSSRISMIKDFQIDSIFLRRNSSSTMKKPTNSIEYHLIRSNQLVHQPNIVRQRIQKNKNDFQLILNRFYDEILRGLKLFSYWEKRTDGEEFFDEYIRLISEILRRLNTLMIYRSNCSIVRSTLHLIADALEMIFSDKKSTNPDVEFLFDNEKLSFSSWHRKNFHLSSILSSTCYSTVTNRTTILNDQRAFISLFHLFQFYQIHSLSITQHIGEHHIDVLLPIHSMNI